VSALRPSLASIYPPDESGSLRLTERGLWHATPLRVLGAAVPVMLEAALVRPGAMLFDAGAGDGRLLAALALGLPAKLKARLAGLESDRDLAAKARLHLDDLRRTHPGARARVACGDYFHPRYHEALGHRPRDLDLVFNYPDGNERRLLEWLLDHGPPGARLVILGPDRDPALGRAPLLRREVRPPGDEVAWTLAVYGRGGE
jgi:hypothetical protein